LLELKGRKEGPDAKKILSALDSIKKEAKKKKKKKADTSLAGSPSVRPASPVSQPSHGQSVGRAVIRIRTLEWENDGELKMARRIGGASEALIRRERETNKKQLRNEKYRRQKLLRTAAERQKETGGKFNFTVLGHTATA